MTYENRHEIADHAENEGGVLDLVFGYGLRVEDLPEDDHELRSALLDLLEVEPVIERFRSLLPDPGTGDYDDDEEY